MTDSSLWTTFARALLENHSLLASSALAQYDGFAPRAARVSVLGIGMLWLMAGKVRACNENKSPPVSTSLRWCVWRTTAGEAALFLVSSGSDLGCEEFLSEAACATLDSPFEPNARACHWDGEYTPACTFAEPDEDDAYSPFRLLSVLIVMACVNPFVLGVEWLFLNVLVAPSLNDDDDDDDDDDDNDDGGGGGGGGGSGDGDQSSPNGRQLMNYRAALALVARTRDPDLSFRRREKAHVARRRDQMMGSDADTIQRRHHCRDHRRHKRTTKIAAVRAKYQRKMASNMAVPSRGLVGASSNDDEPSANPVLRNDDTHDDKTKKHLSRPPRAVMSHRARQIHEYEVAVVHASARTMSTLTAKRQHGASGAGGTVVGDGLGDDALDGNVDSIADLTKFYPMRVLSAAATAFEDMTGVGLGWNDDDCDDTAAPHLAALAKQPPRAPNPNMSVGALARGMRGDDGGEIAELEASQRPNSKVT